jgi:hypothetical protein
MKKIPYILLGFVLAACQPHDVEETVEVRLAVKLPKVEGQQLSVSNCQVSAKELNMGSITTLAVEELGDTIALSLKRGYYDLELRATVCLANDTMQLRGYRKGLAVAAQTTDSIVCTLSGGNAGWVIAEVFFAGTQTPEGKNYIGDKYVVLYNNSNDTLDASGLVLIESKLKNTSKYTLTPDFRNKHIGADALYRIPLDKPYRIAPGKRILLVDNAMNHTEANTNSFDLSTADWEWYDQSTNPKITDVDNPDVPNLEKIYCYTLTIWGPNNQGNTSFAIGRLPDTLDVNQYLTQYKLDYDYVNVTSAGTFNMSATTYLFPNEWVLDAVNLCPSDTYQWLVVDLSLDAGYTYVAATGSDKTRFGKSVRRKTSVTIDQRRVLQDTNNSTDDFLTAQTADPFYFN